MQIDDDEDYEFVDNVETSGIFKIAVGLAAIFFISMLIPMKLYARSEIDRYEFVESMKQNLEYKYIPLSKSSEKIISRTQRYLYNNKKPIIEEGFFYDDKYSFNVTWYTHEYEVVLNIYSSKRNYDADDIDFGIYCCMMSFIDDNDHLFADFLELKRDIQFNINGTNNVLTTVKFTLYD